MCVEVQNGYLIFRVIVDVQTLETNLLGNTMQQEMDLFSLPAIILQTKTFEIRISVKFIIALRMSCPRSFKLNAKILNRMRYLMRLKGQCYTDKFFSSQCHLLDGRGQSMSVQNHAFIYPRAFDCLSLSYWIKAIWAGLAIIFERFILMIIVFQFLINIVESNKAIDRCYLKKLVGLSVLKSPEKGSHNKGDVANIMAANNLEEKSFYSVKGDLSVYEYIHHDGMYWKIFDDYWCFVLLCSRNYGNGEDKYGIPDDDLHRIMSARGIEFIAEVNRLPVDQMRSLLRHEVYRLRTFEAGWPHEDFLPSAVLARTGFRFLNGKDSVQCVFCSCTLGNWKKGDEIQARHRKHSPDCRIIEGGPDGNISKPEILTEPYGTTDDMNELGYFRLGKGYRDRPLLGTFENLGIKMDPHPVSPEYSRGLHRIHSFKGAFIAYDLSKLGFFKNPDDSLQCFQCGIMMKNWDSLAIEELMEEHVKRSRDCRFIKSSQDYDVIVVIEDQQHLHGFTASQKHMIGDELKAEDEPRHYAEIASICRSLGHRQSDIAKVIHQNRKQPIKTIEEMLQYLHALEDKTHALDEDADQEALIEEGWSKCQACLKLKAENLSLPCGCLALCISCGENGVPDKCFKCQRKVNGLLRVFQSVQSPEAEFKAESALEPASESALESASESALESESQSS